MTPPRLYLLACLIIVLSIPVFGWDTTWSLLGIGSLEPGFADLRSIQAGLGADAHGINPQQANRGDPLGRPMNYPSVWLSIARFLHWEIERNLLLSGAACGAMFAACCHHIISRWPSWWAVPLCLFGAPALMVERANNDSVVFVLVFLGAVSARGWFAVLLPAATLLKIFPVLALPAFARDRRLFVMAAAGCVAAGVFLLPQIPLIRSGTPASLLLSYGLPVYVMGFAAAGVSVPPEAIGAALLGLAILVSRRACQWLDATDAAEDKVATRLFLAGTGLYIGTTLLGANWDYRACVLLMTIPFVGKLPSARLRNTLIGLLALALNQALIEDVGGLPAVWLNLAAKASLFVLMGGLAIRIAPQALGLSRAPGPSPA